MVAIGAGGVRGGERSSAVHFSSFLTVAMCSNQAENYYMRVLGFFSSFQIVRFHFSLFLRCCCAGQCFLFRTYSKHI